MSFLVFTLPFNTSKTIAKQFTSSIPAEEEDSSSKIPDVNEYDSKIVQTFKQIHFSNDIFYILTKEKFAHYIHHVFPVDWLETFSPPPDAA